MPLNIVPRTPMASCGGQHVSQCTITPRICCSSDAPGALRRPMSSSCSRRKVRSSDGLTYVVGADLAEGGELVVDDHVCGGLM